MEMHQVRYFLALCDELHFTRAARRCGVKQPSLTRAIKMLEKELGGALFERERGNARCQMQKLSAVGTFHFEPPSLVSIRSPRDEQRLRNFEAKARTLLVCTEHRTPPPSTIPRRGIALGGSSLRSQGRDDSSIAHSVTTRAA